VVSRQALVKWSASLKASSNLLYRLAEGPEGKRPACAPTLERMAREQSYLSEKFLKRAEQAQSERESETLLLDLADPEPERESALGKL
jgi:hypothetical protein